MTDDRLSIGVQKGPPIGVQEGPPFERAFPYGVARPGAVGGGRATP